MPDDFDPYYKWLGIPPAEQPPNHYRLLGVQAFEPDVEVIEAAADRHVAYLQDVATGPHVRESQKLLNEIVAARLCLLDKQKRAAYDLQLRQRSTSPPAATSAPSVFPPIEVKPPTANRLEPPPVADRFPRPTANRAEPAIPTAWIVVGSSATGLVIVALIVILGIGPRDRGKTAPTLVDHDGVTTVERPALQPPVTEPASGSASPQPEEPAGGIAPLLPNSVASAPNTMGELVAHYTFERTDDPGWDAAGRHSASAATATVQQDADRGSRVLVLSGENDCLDIPRSIEDDFTIALWIKTAQEGKGGAYWHMGVGIVDGDVDGPAHDFGLSLSKGKAAFGVGTQGTTIKSHRAINDDRWHHVAVTRESSTGRIKLYVDGDLEGDAIGPAGPKDAPPRLAVGRSGSAPRHFEGRMDDLRIYDGVLAQSQIRELMSATAD